MSGRAIGRWIGMVAIAWSCAAAPTSGATSATRPAIAIYSNDFDKPPGPEWSNRSCDVTPKGKRNFLGQFGGEEVRLQLKGLPAHRFLRLRFDLYMLNPVDGSSPIWGPDVWDLTVDNGPTLLHTTFTNCGFFTDNNAQAFPDEFPCKPHPGWTGAAEKQTLGYIASWGGPDRTHGVDSVYTFDMTFPHAGDAVTFVFTSFSPEDKKGESWGLDNVKVEVMDQAAALTRDEFEMLWKRLGSEDPFVAFRAKWNLIAAADDANELLTRRLGADAVDPERIGTLLDQLSAQDPAARERATTDLIGLGDRIIPTLLGKLSVPMSPEAASRMGKVLRALSDPTSDRFDALRRARAFHALEILRGQPNPLRRDSNALPSTADGETAKQLQRQR